MAVLMQGSLCASMAWPPGMESILPLSLTVLQLGWQPGVILQVDTCGSVCKHQQGGRHVPCSFIFHNAFRRRVGAPSRESRFASVSCGISDECISAG